VGEPDRAAGVGDEPAGAAAAPAEAGQGRTPKAVAHVLSTIRRPGVDHYELAAEAGIGGSGAVRLHELDERDRAILTGLVVSLKTAGYGYRQIRKMTKLGQDTVMRILREARERDGLRDVLADLDMELVPQAVDNMRQYLRRPWTPQGERATFEIAEGRGVLVKHQKNQTAVAGSMEFTVKYLHAPDALPPPTGTIVSCARED
jgi:DNA-binding Lrp family transcriptional regulator